MSRGKPRPWLGWLLLVVATGGLLTSAGSLLAEGGLGETMLDLSLVFGALALVFAVLWRLYGRAGHENDADIANPS